MASEVHTQAPQMEIFTRMLELPLVESAICKSAEQYSRVKDGHQLVHWLFSTAETLVTNASKQAAPIALPIAKKLKTPILFVDHKLCLGLDKIQEKVPLVKEKPEQILETAYMLALQTVTPAVVSLAYVNDLMITQASNLRDISWNKANQILGTQYGSAAVKGLDNTALVVDKLIDKYFPATEDEQAINIEKDEEDKLLHTLQTVGRLSNKAARRVYLNIKYHLVILNKDHLRSYISSVLEFLHLTRYLHAINDKVQTCTSNGQNSEKKNN